MDGLRHVEKYQFVAAIRETTVDWSLGIEVEGGERYLLPITDGAEVPILLDLFRRDPTVFYDPKNRRVSTGWNKPGA